MIVRSRTKFVVALLAVLLVAAVEATAQTKVTTPSQRPQAATDLPLSLSDADGQGLVIESLAVRTAISGMLSLTELDVVFRNPQERQIEGRFDTTLPANASISRFAKEINGTLMEGEVVERLRANQVYEQFLHQMRDPALLEQDQGNRFSARIFPIAPRASVRIILSYSQLLESRDGRRAWSFPIRGLRNIGSFSFRATIAPLPGEGSVSNTRDIKGGGAVSTTDVVSREEKNFSPDHDLELSWSAPASGSLGIVQAGGFYVASLRVPDRPLLPEKSVPIVAYVDTSASAGIAGEHRIDAIERFFASLPASQQVEVVAFDISLVPLLKGTAPDVSAKLPTLLHARHFLGGTDLGLVADDIARRAGSNSDQRFLVVSDGVATLGETSDIAILDRVRNVTGTRFDALVIGGRQAPLLRRLTTGRGRILEVPLTESFLDSAKMAAAELLEPLGEPVTITDPNAEWVFPGSLSDLRAGRELFVLGKLKDGRTQSGLRIAGPSSKFSAAAQTELPSRGFDLLLEREAFRAYLDYLGDRAAAEPDAAIRSGIERERVEISKQHRIVIPSTTMLVLETEWDYQRFNIDRRALAAILTIGATGIERMQRTSVAVFSPPAPAPPPQQVTKPAPNAVTQSLSGTVKQGRRTVSGALVRVSGVTLSTPRDARTDDRGKYTVAGLPAGLYSVRFESGSIVRMMDVTVTQQSPARLDVDLAAPAEPRGADGTLSGTVMYDGAPLPGTTITAQGSGLSRTAVTNVQGDWSLTVPPGQYSLRAEMSGMLPQVKNVSLRAGGSQRVNFTLALSAVAQAITVTAAAPAVLETTEVSSNFNAQMIEDVPAARSIASTGEIVAATPPATMPDVRPRPEPAPSVASPATPRSNAGSASPASGMVVAGTPPQAFTSPPQPGSTAQQAKTDTSWTAARASTGEVGRLESAIRDNPTDRTNYTELSELLVSMKEWKRLYDLALLWQPYDPENPQVYEVLGEAALAMKHHDDALRAFASIVEVAASRPELLQRAGLLLLRAGGGALAEAPLRKAVELRPDRVNAHRHLALFLWKEKRFGEAAAVLEKAQQQTYPAWYGDVRRVLGEELGYVYRAWGDAVPAKRKEIADRARENGVDLARVDALRITLAWETDATDVDLHVVDPAGEECFYAHAWTASGLNLYADITQGLGPEVVRTDKAMKGTYSIGVNYFAAGAMGVSRGVVTIIRTDRKGANPDVEIVPFRLVQASRGADIRLVAKATF